MKLFEELGGSWESFGDPDAHVDPMQELNRMAEEQGRIMNAEGGAVSELFREIGYMNGKERRFDAGK